MNFPAPPVNCELDFHLDFILSICLDSVNQAVKVVEYDNNRVLLTEILTMGEKKHLDIKE